MIDNIQSKFWNSDTCISEATQIHLLVLELWELLVKSQNGFIVFILGSIVTDLRICSVRKACPCRTFNVKNVSLLVPVVGIVSEVRCVASESKLTFGV